MGDPSISACTWMATLAVEVSFLLFLLRTSVCVNSPVSSEALTYTSLAAGVLIGHERTVTHPFVAEVCLISASSDEEYANFADGCPADDVAPSPFRAPAAPRFCPSGLSVLADFPQAPRTSREQNAPKTLARRRSDCEEPEPTMRSRSCVTSSKLFMVSPLRSSTAGALSERCATRKRSLPSHGSP